IQGSIHLGKSEMLPVPLERIRGIGGRLSILLLFECGVLGSSLKKVLEAFIQVTKGLLNRYAGDISQPRIFFLEIRQHGSKIVVGEPHASFVGSRSGMQSAG